MKEFNFFPSQRNRYFYGKLLTVRDFEAEQRYFSAKRRLINRTIHGVGIVCGLGVSGIDDATLMVEGGMALDYLGREVVVEEPLIRKLEMIDGQESLKGRDDAYLCLAYDESDLEPVNAVGADVSESRQFNMTREGYRLFFSTEAPDYRGLLEASGKENVNIIYASDGLTLVLSAPGAVCAGDEFDVNVLVVKNGKTPPVRFTLSGVNNFAESDTGHIQFAYNESPEETRNVVLAAFKIKAQGISGITGQLFPDGAELNVELGSHKYKNFITVDADIFLCKDRNGFEEYTHKKDTLARHLQGRELPIYLAKLELISSTDRVFLGAVTNMPFGQKLLSEAGAKSEGMDQLAFTASVRSLEFWQKPDVQARYNQASASVHLDFGIPTPELYDYATSHGVVDVAAPGGIKVNARYFTDEIPHGLGPGNVDVRLSVEFEDAGELANLFGNSEVFRAKSMKLAPPWVETAVVVYPKRGTMRIGVWLHDDVPGNLIRVHYYAEKPERDTKRLLEKRQISVGIIPEVARLARREQMRFKALVTGSDDKNVSWEVKDENGGAIDKNGIYQAPEVQGTYELVARSTADETVAASAFVIVE